MKLLERLFGRSGGNELLPAPPQEPELTTVTVDGRVITVPDGREKLFEQAAGGNLVAQETLIGYSKARERADVLRLYSVDAVEAYEKPDEWLKTLQSLKEMSENR